MSNNLDKHIGLQERIESDMRQAMKNRDTGTTAALKALLARFSSEEAVQTSHQTTGFTRTIAGAKTGVGRTEATRKSLTEADYRHIIQQEIDEIQQVVNLLDQPSDYKTELEQKVAILQRYSKKDGNV